jgi:hypothetical protein
VFRPLVTRMALAVTSRLEEDPASKTAGFIIDTPGTISQGKGGVYENIEHIISEFSGASCACLVLSSLSPAYAYLIYIFHPQHSHGRKKPHTNTT